MPQVPTYTPQVAPFSGRAPRAPEDLLAAPGVPADPRALTLGGQAASAAMGQVVQSGVAAAQAMGQAARFYDEVSQAGFRLVEHVQSTAQMTRTEQVNSLLAQEAQRIRQDPNIQPDRYQEEFSRSAQEIIRDNGEGLIGPWAAKYEASTAGVASRALIQLTDKAWEQANQERFAALKMKQDRLIKEYGIASPEQQKAIKDELYNDYNQLTQIKALAPQQAAAAKIALDKVLVINEVKALIDFDPQKALERLTDKKISGTLDADQHYRLKAMAQSEQDRRERVNQARVISAEVQSRLAAHGPSGALDSVVQDISAGRIDSNIGLAAFRELHVIQSYQMQRLQQAQMLQDRNDAQQYAKIYASGDPVKVMDFARTAAANGNPHAISWIDAAERKAATLQDAAAKTRYDLNWGDFTRVVRARDAEDSRVKSVGGDFQDITAALLLTPVERGGFGLDPARMDDAFKLLDSSTQQARKGGTNYTKQAMDYATGILGSDKAKLATFAVTLQNQMNGMKDKAGRPLDDYSPEVFDIGRNLLSEKGTGLWGGRRYEKLEQERQAGKPGSLLQHPDWFDPTAPAAPPEQPAKTRTALREAGLPDTATGRALLRQPPRDREQVVIAWGPGFAELVDTYGIADVILARQSIQASNAKLPAGVPSYPLSVVNVERMIKNLRGQ